MTIKTVLHTFSFDTNTAEGKAAWKAFEAQRKAERAPTFGPILSDVFHSVEALNGQTVELDPGPNNINLFDNQWNTAASVGSDKGLRVFDFALQADFGSHIPKSAPCGVKRGHYLEQTEEMREIRRNTAVCGYCGHKEAAQRGAVFCPKCIGSESLKETDLRLTRMVPIESSDADRAPLTDAERAHLLPLYREAQREGGATRAGRAKVRARADVLAKYERATSNATTERDGMLWLLDRDIGTDNVIFYSHSGRFGFGWRSKLSPEQVGVVLDFISEFPFPYDLNCADGRKLSGN